MAETWPAVLTSSEHVGQALDWVRWKTQGKVMLVIAIGPNSIAIAKDRELRAIDAVEILENEAKTIAEILGQLDQRKVTHAAKRRQGAEGTGL